MPDSLVLLGSACPIVRGDGDTLRWTTRTGTLTDHMESLDVSGDGLLQ